MSKGNARIVVKQQKNTDPKEELVVQKEPVTTEEIVPQTTESFNQFKYIKHIYECERDLQILKERSKEIRYEIDDLYPVSFEKSKMCAESQKQEKYYAEKRYPKKITNNSQKASENAATVMSIAFIGGGVLTVIYAISKIFFGSRMSEMFTHLGKNLLSAVILFIIILAIAGLIALSLIILGKNKDKAENEQAKLETDKYNELVRKSNNNIANKNKSKVENCKREYELYYQKQNQIKDLVYPMLSSERETVSQRIQELSATLQMLYNLKIDDVYCLHPNYRGLSTISIIYGYFETGRCTQLQGHEGAYNLYEDEKLKGIIISKVNEISYKLDKLNATMSYVGMVMNEISNKVDDLANESARVSSDIANLQNQISQTGDKINSNISSQLNSIKENTANSAYYSEVGARASTFNAMYNYLK